MSSTSRLPRILKNLLLALLNATLILLAICLFLGWQISREMNALAGTFAENLVEITPLRDEVQEARMEIAGLRDDLAQLADKGSAVPANLQSRLETLDGRMDLMSERAQSLAEAPEQLMQQAVQRATAGLGQVLVDASACRVPGSVVAPAPDIN